MILWSNAFLINHFTDLSCIESDKTSAQYLENLYTSKVQAKSQYKSMLENRAALLYNLLNLFCMQFSSLHAQTVSAAAFSIAFPKLGICFTSADSHTALYGSLP